eukprot:SAG31_NODE_597_length_13674_cov_3.402947_14_plen_135_part_00
MAEIDQSHAELLSKVIQPLGAIFADGEGGQVITRANGKTVWEPSKPALTRVFSDQPAGVPTPAALKICAADMMTCMSQPFCYEIPQFLLDMVAAEPTSSIAERYRSYARTMLVPILRRVVTILRDHSSAIEWYI